MNIIGIYLASYTANHPNHHIIYQDINGKRDLSGDMMEINLEPFDYIIATPPCNWWSRANYRRNTSEYALKTKHLLIDILHELIDIGKPFIVENVRNDKFFKEYGLLDLPSYVYRIGRHTYWTNMNCDLIFHDIVQKPLVEIRNGKRIWLSSQHLPRNKRQGGNEVHEVIEKWITYVETWLMMKGNKNG